MTYDQMTRSADVVLVEFYATWCGHCRRMAPVVDQLNEMRFSGKRTVITECRLRNASKTTLWVGDVRSWLFR